MWNGYLLVMTIELTREWFSQHLQQAYRPGLIASNEGFDGDPDRAPMKCAAVLIPLIRWQEQWHLVFTRRTDTVEHHKGQVSFPGGGCDSHESDPATTALREAHEEIGLLPGDVHLLGRLNDIVTITKYRVTPVVGIMPWPYPIRLEPAEVSRVFTIPLLWLSQPGNWDERPFDVPGFSRKTPVITYHLYDGEILWGASARITHNFLTAVGLKGSGRS
jgi:8-oxo-dGTP pyrophosphatase MutT (NUDIX family)